MSHPPRVSVVIVSYNTRALTAKAVQSVYTSEGFAKDELEVIVVDNGSTDDSVSYLRQCFPQLQLITNSDNRGFGSGNNQGAQAAKGQYLLLLNSDAYLESFALRTIVDRLAGDPTLSCVGPQLTYPDGRLQLSGGYFPTLARAVAWMLWLDRLPLVKLLFPRPYHVSSRVWHCQEQHPDWLMGACLLFRRRKFLATGGFDEQIFMYAEEVELFLRLARSGQHVLFTPSARVVHLGGQSAPRLTLELKGIEYFYTRHYPKQRWLAKLVMVVGVLLRLLVFSLLPHRRHSAREYLNYLRHR